MFRNYLKTAWRNLLKNKFYSLLNIAGLTAGLTIGLLILLWVRDEISFDAFHRNTASIYKVELFGGTGSSRQIWHQTVAPIGPLAKQALPEVKDQVRICSNDLFSLYKSGDKVFGNEVAVFTDPSFFSIFDFPLIQRKGPEPYDGDNAVVITQSIAIKYFGKENPIGKIIVADSKVNLTVTGVIEDFPANSSMRYDMMMPMSYYAKRMLEQKVDLAGDFHFYNYNTFLQLQPGKSAGNLSKELYQIHIRHKADDTDAEYLLQPLSKMHLYQSDGSNAGIETVRIFSIVAGLILLIACINYVNLSTARSIMRAKEIGMRKIVGAARWQLFVQFIIETALLFGLVTLLSIAGIFAVLPLFNTVSGKNVAFHLYDYHNWLIIGSTIAGSLVASSIYPAMLLSAFEPLKALKGRISKGMGHAAFRKGLVVCQFVFSVALIIGTLVISKQLNYVRSKELGYDKTNIFSFWMRDMNTHYDAVRSELEKQPGVTGVTRGSANIVQIGGISGETEWDGKEANQTFIIHPMAIDRNFIPFFKMNLVQGSGFDGTAADSTHVILNEQAIRDLQMKDPIGKRFRIGGVKGTIIGVVKDFHFASMKEKIGPAVFVYVPGFCNRMYVKTTAVNASKAILAAEQQFKKFNGAYPFNYAFLDESFNKLYQSEEKEGTLFNYFSGIAIMISTLGLLGLAAYTAQMRIREIGVRKVLGAGVPGIVGLLAGDFIKLVLIAILIACPIAWFAMNQWLETFSYRIDIGGVVFVEAGLIAVVVAFMTISFQTVSAAMANPTKSLRSE